MDAWTQKNIYCQDWFIGFYVHETCVCDLSIHYSKEELHHQESEMNLNFKAYPGA